MRGIFLVVLTARVAVASDISLVNIEAKSQRNLWDGRLLGNKTGSNLSKGWTVYGLNSPPQGVRAQPPVS